MKLGAILLCLALISCAAKPKPAILDGCCREGKCKVIVYLAGAECPLAEFNSNDDGYWRFTGEDGKKYDIRFIELVGEKKQFTLHDMEGKQK